MFENAHAKCRLPRSKDKKVINFEAMYFIRKLAISDSLKLMTQKLYDQLLRATRHVL